MQRMKAQLTADQKAALRCIARSGAYFFARWLEGPGWRADLVALAELGFIVRSDRWVLTPKGVDALAGAE